MNIKFFNKAKNILLVMILAFNANITHALIQEDDFRNIQGDDNYPSYNDLINNTNYCFQNGVLIDSSWVLAPANQNFDSVLTSDGQKLEIDMWIKHPDYAPNAKWNKIAYNFQFLHLKNPINIPPIQRMLWNKKGDNSILRLFFATTQKDNKRQIGSSLSQIKNNNPISMFNYQSLSLDSEYRTLYESMMQPEDAGTGVLFSNNLKPPYQLLGLLSKVNPDFSDDPELDANFISENIIGKTNSIINKAIMSESIEGVNGLVKAFSRFALDSDNKVKINARTQLKLPNAVSLNGVLIDRRLVLTFDNNIKNPKVYSQVTIGNETIPVIDINLINQQSGLRLLFLEKESTIPPIEILNQKKLEQNFILLPANNIASVSGPPLPPPGGPSPIPGFGPPSGPGSSKKSNLNKSTNIPVGVPLTFEATTNIGLTWVNTSTTIPAEMGVTGIAPKPGYPLLLAQSNELNNPNTYKLYGFNSGNYRKFDTETINWIENVKRSLLSPNFERLLEDLSSNDKNLIETALKSPEIINLKKLSSAENLVKAVKQSNEEIKKTKQAKQKLAKKSLPATNGITQNYVFFDNDWIMALNKGSANPYKEVSIGKEKFPIEDPKTKLIFALQDNYFLRVMTLDPNSTHNIKPIQRTRNSNLENNYMLWFADPNRTITSTTGKVPVSDSDVLGGFGKLKKTDTPRPNNSTTGGTSTDSDSAKYISKPITTLKPGFLYNDQIEIMKGEGNPIFGSGLFVEKTPNSPIQLIGFLNAKDNSIKDKILYSDTSIPEDINNLMDKFVLAKALGGMSTVEKIYNEYMGTSTSTTSNQTSNASTAPKRPQNTGKRLDYLIAELQLSYNFINYKLYDVVGNQFYIVGRSTKDALKPIETFLEKFRKDAYADTLRKSTIFLPTDNALSNLNPIVYSLVTNVKSKYFEQFIKDHYVKDEVLPNKAQIVKTGVENLNSIDINFTSLPNTNLLDTYINTLEYNNQNINVIDSKVASNGYVYLIDQPIISTLLTDKLKNDYNDAQNILLGGIRSIDALRSVTAEDLKEAIEKPFKSLPATLDNNTILDTLKSQANCSEFVKIIAAAQLDDYFKLTGDYTLLAPTNDVLKKTLKTLKYDDVDDMIKSLSQSDLKYYIKLHLIAKKVTSDQFNLDSVKHFVWSNDIIEFQNKSGNLTAGLIVYTKESAPSKELISSQTRIIEQPLVSNGVIYLLDESDLVQPGIFIEKFRKR